ncbi:uncharacterized protein A1O9_12532 [Exophiala aquamarina CBS 119918]|uniref:Kynurenine formamidase n=1 Tax=Exophiala aquamarina CBS 119918 TaxID=1182545 RepID=A0A072NWH9_9EURO|nr:uncharacterized protein A1O9_12532 [Exophiala aquamarina CBS 119918]KEF51383.1 hypothetical protein A1O9_12532 [Exophiala aquamarina CBS 119918]
MADEEFGSLWDSVPWQQWDDSPDLSSPKKAVGWYKPSVPYVHGGHELQTLDVWLPSPSSSPSSPSSPSSSAPAAKVEQHTPEQLLLSRKNNGDKWWIVYIHGGAWCDPDIRADSFGATLHHLLKFPDSLRDIAGVVSLNYTLSPSHHHGGATPSRSGKHPDHIVDVLCGLAFVQKVTGFAENYTLVGHSCGATLAFQVMMDVARWSSASSPEDQAAAHVPKVCKPCVVIGLDGLYDLPGLINDPGDKHAGLIPAYDAFTRSAFGDDENTWYDVSPVSVKDWVEEWGPENGTVVLVQSQDDTLVPYRQLVGMQAALKSSIGASIGVVELSASGDHDELWQTGDQIAGIIAEVLKRRGRLDQW